MAIKKPNLKPRSAPVAEAAVVDPNPPAPPTLTIVITVAPGNPPTLNWQNGSPFEVLAYMELLRDDLKGQLRGYSLPPT